MQFLLGIGVVGYIATTQIGLLDPGNNKNISGNDLFPFIPVPFIFLFPPSGKPLAPKF